MCLKRRLCTNVFLCGEHLCVRVFNVKFCVKANLCQKKPCVLARACKSFHKDMFSHRHLHIHMLLLRDGFTRKYRKYLHAQVFFHRDAFIPKKLLHTDAWALLHADAFTQRCFHRGVHLCVKVSVYHMLAVCC